MYRKQIRRRRAILVALIVTSLVLLSAHFSEAESGRSTRSSAAWRRCSRRSNRWRARLSSPPATWSTGSTRRSRRVGENDELREDLAAARAELAEAQDALGRERGAPKTARPRRQDRAAGFAPRTSPSPRGSSTARRASVNATVGINAGSGDGVEVNDPVVNGDGLVGRVTETTAATAQVQLITDPRNAVSARLLPEGPEGVVEPEAGDPDDLRLDFIANDEEVQEGQILVTAGWSNGAISSAYPFGIAIGESPRPRGGTGLPAGARRAVRRHA